MRRREMLLTAGAMVVGASTFPMGWTAAESKKQKVLYFTRSAGFIHSVVNRHNRLKAYSETIFEELGRKHGFEVVCSQTPTVLESSLDAYDAIVFYTSGDPLTARGKKNLLAAIASGKGFVGLHAATDTFLSPGVDPYIAMIGAEFVVHAKQQPAVLRVVDPKFPGMEGLGDRLTLLEEWYTFGKFAPDLHVILMQETAGMIGDPYRRPPYPATWARRHGKGRVFYTSLGHREDVWTNPKFEQILLGGLAWTLGNVEADVTPNLAQVAPGANEFTPPPKKAS
ncbi:MAG: ThuA domain-containing protein [Thermoguttaceae bacterium]